MSRPISRRAFVAMSSGAAVAPLFVPASVLGRLGRLGANDVLGLGFIGMGKRAQELLGPFLDRKDCRVLAVCDVDTTRREDAKKRVDTKYANTACRGFNDYRELLALKDVDAVVIATPDHWHVNQVVDACAAGKDIYCEKPLTLKLREGKVMIDAVRKAQRVFQ